MKKTILVIGVTATPLFAITTTVVQSQSTTKQQPTFQQNNLTKAAKSGKPKILSSPTVSYEQNLQFNFINKKKKQVSFDAFTAIKTSNVLYGGSAKIFQDSRGVLWLFTYGSPLQYSTDGITWKNADRSSNIKIGYYGTFLEAHDGTLWSVGQGTGLQYSKDGKTWKAADASSNITNGAGAVIFQDSRNTLWSMSHHKPLQYSTDGVHWQVSKSSNIWTGYFGKIFEDSRGTLWSVGDMTGLQFSTDGKTWQKSATSNITNGYKGLIFEDSRHWLWSMGHNTKLQVSKDGKTWSEVGASFHYAQKNTVQLLQDSRGTLWSFGNGGLMQYTNDGITWHDETTSSVKNARWGKMFEDSKGRLWIGASASRMEYTTDGKTWIKTGTSSNVVDGASFIFEDLRGTLWSTSLGRPLQFSADGGLKWYNKWNRNTAKITLHPAQKYHVEIKKYNTANQTGLLFDGYEWAGDLTKTHLQFKKASAPASEYTNLNLAKGKLLTLDAAKYDFKWVLGTDEIAASAFPTQVFTITTTQLAFNYSSVSHGKLADGVVKFTSGLSSNAKIELEYSADNGTTWKKVHDQTITELSAGVVKLRWVPIRGGKFPDFTSSKDAGAINVVAFPTAPTFSIASPTFKGASDGAIEITNYLDTTQQSTLQYSTNAGVDWKDVTSQNITSLAKSVYNFRWVIKNQGIYQNATTIQNLGTQVVPDGINLQAPTIIPGFKVTHPSLKGAQDGAVTVSNLTNTYSKLQYANNNGLFVDVPLNGIITNLAKTTLNFQWVGKNNENYTNNQKVMAVRAVDLKDPNIVATPNNPTYVITKKVTAKGLSEGAIKVQNYTNTYSQLQYAVANGNFKNVPTDGIIKGLPAGDIRFQWIPKNGETYTNTQTSAAAGVIKIATPNVIIVPQDPQYTITSPTQKGLSDGKIEVKNNTNQYSTLKYSSDNLIFIPVPQNGLITGLKTGKVHFMWVPKNGEKYSNGANFHETNHAIIGASTIIATPVNPTFKTTMPTAKGQKDGSLIVTGWENKDSKLQYKNAQGQYVDVPASGLINGLGSGNIAFQWVPKGANTYVNALKIKAAGTATIAASNKIVIPKHPTYTHQKETSVGAKDAKITITNSSDTYSKLQYSTDGKKTWTDVSGTTVTNLAPGIVAFQWVGKGGEQYSDQTLAQQAWSVTTKASTLIATADVQNPTYKITKNLSAKGRTDATLTVTNISTKSSAHSQLQYSVDNKLSYKDVPSDGVIGNLGVGTITFQWQAKDNQHHYADGTNSKFAGAIDVSEALQILAPTKTPTYTLVPETFKGGNDAKITVANWSDAYSKLQYAISSNGFIDVDSSGIINELSAGVIKFRWVGKFDEEYVDKTTFKTVAAQTIAAAAKIAVPTVKPAFTVKIPSALGANDATITVTNWADPDSKLQYKTTQGQYIDVPTSGLITGLAADTIDFQWTPKDTVKTYHDTLKNPSPLTITASNKIAIPKHPTYTHQKETSVGAKDAKITITNSSDTYSKLQYSTDGKKTWTDVGGTTVTNLAPGIVAFQWVGKGGEEYSDQTLAQQAWSVTTKDSTLIATADVQNPTYKITKNLSAKGRTDATLTVTNIGTKSSAHSQLQYSVDNKLSYKDVPSDGVIGNLGAGTITFQWQAKDNQHHYADGTNSKFAGAIKIKVVQIIVIPSAPTYQITQAQSQKGQADAVVTLASSQNGDSQLQYSVNNGLTFIDVPTNGVLTKLAPGVIKFRWIPKDQNNTYLGGQAIVTVAPAQVVASNKIPNPQKTYYIQVAPSAKGAQDGTVKITNAQDQYSQLQYAVDGVNFIDVPANNVVSGLTSGTLKFRWVPKNSAHQYLQNKTAIGAGTAEVAQADLITIPTLPVFVVTATTGAAKTDGAITIQDWENNHSTLQYSLDGGVTYMNVTNAGKITNLPVQVVNFRWVGKNDEKYTDGKQFAVVGTINVDQPQTPAQGGLGTGGIIGIVAGSLAGAGAILFSLLKFLKVKK